MKTKQVSLKEYSSLRIGGEANLVDISSIADLVETVMAAKRDGKRTYVLGEGTNTFFGDNLTNILFLHMVNKGISFEEHGNDVRVTAQAGEIWDDIVSFSVERGLWGIENLSAIPGTIGAAPIQNIGAYGIELKDVFVSLTALDCITLSVVEIDSSACAFGYRDSLFKQVSGRYIIISVTLMLSRTKNPILSYAPLHALVDKESLTSREIREFVIATRKAKLPDYKLFPNAGSFFKNPFITDDVRQKLSLVYPAMPFIQTGDRYKIPSAWLIEHVAQMKGVQIRNMGTWPNQPLVIVNYGEADGDEVVSFSQNIIDRIQEKTGITLEREVQYVEQ